MNKQNILLVIVVALLAGGLVFAGTFFSRTEVIQVDNQGRPLGAISSALDVGRELGINGVQRIVVNGSFVDATTTIVSLLNPFPATSTVSFIGLFNTGVATTSYNINCGQSIRASAPAVTSNPTVLFYQSPVYATSSIFTQVLHNATSTGGFEGAYVGPSQYLQCVTHGVTTNDITQTSGSWDSAFSGSQNTFDGKYWIEFMGLIQ